MPKPLLIKPILKVLKNNELSKYILDTKRLTNTDIVKLVRSKYDSKMRTALANEMGIPVKHLKEVIGLIRDTPARRLAVKGNNFLQNIYKQSGIKPDSISKYIKEMDYNVINPALTKLNQVIKNKTGGEIQLPKELLYSKEEFNIEMIDDIIEGIDSDMWYNDGDGMRMVTVAADGFKIGLSEDRYLRYITDMLEKGYFEQVNRDEVY